MRPAAIRNHAAYALLYLAPIAVAVSFNSAYVYWLVVAREVGGIRCSQRLCAS